MQSLQPWFIQLANNELIAPLKVQGSNYIVVVLQYSFHVRIHNALIIVSLNFFIFALVARADEK